MKLKGSKTEKNLLGSFAGESQARNRYLFWAKIAKKEGYVQIAKIFEETAEQEGVHAKTFFKHLQEAGDAHDVEITAAFPTGPMGTTEENLRAAAGGEKHEFTDLYPGFADIAEEEGFKKIAFTWRMISRAEEWHYERYIALANNIADASVFKRDQAVKWGCIHCGYIHTGETPPEKCPSCDHPKGYFQIHNALF
ncbi:MAG: rubrerythrin [Candidatus Thorarchaeota archaeon]